MPDYQEDDIMPNDGTYFGIPSEPLDQSIGRKKEKAQTLEALSVIESVIQHFTERIAFRDSLEAIKPDLTKDPALHQKICEANELLKMALMEEKQMLEELLEMHGPR